MFVNIFIEEMWYYSILPIIFMHFHKRRKFEILIIYQQIGTTFTNRVIFIPFGVHYLQKIHNV